MTESVEPVPPAVLAWVDAEHVPLALTSRRRDWIALLPRRASARACDVLKPAVFVAGTKIDARNFGLYRASRLHALRLFHVATRRLTEVATPGECDLWPIGFSHDARFFVYVAFGQTRIELCWVECATGRSGALTTARLNGVSLGGPLTFTLAGFWMGDQHRILCRLVHEAIASHPIDERDDIPTYESGEVLSAHDPVHAGGIDRASREQRLHQYCTSQMAIVGIPDGVVHAIGEPGLVQPISVSPDGQYALVQRCLLPLRKTTTLATASKVIEAWSLADGGSPLPVSLGDTGRREFRWHPNAPAVITWLERTPAGGDVLRSWNAPFAGDTGVELETAGPCVKFGWTTAGRLLAWEIDTRRNRLRLHSRGVDAVEGVPLETSVGNDGLRVCMTSAAGAGEFLEHEGHVYVAGSLSGEISIPYLDKVDIRTGATSRLFESSPDVHEAVVSVLTDDGRLLLTLREGPALTPRYCLVDSVSDSRAEIDAAKPPSVRPPIFQSFPVGYTSLTGATECALAHLPEGARGTPSPFVVWLYPTLKGGVPIVAPSRKLAANRYLQPTEFSPLFLLSYGFGVLESPPMPLDGAVPTFVDDLVASATTICEALVASGQADPSRLIVGGHCGGAWAAAMLLAHSTLFCAGIGCSGHYSLALSRFNHTIAGRRPMWDDPAAWTARVPVALAKRIRRPFLLIHGEADAMIPSRESEEMYRALSASGGAARLVLLAGEEHVYEGRFGRLTALREMARWCAVHTASSTASVA